MNNTSNDTICAIATAWGGAIGIIRVSGGEAISIADKIFKPAAKGGEPLSGRGANTVTYGRIVDERGETVDDVLVSLFRKPRSTRARTRWKSRATARATSSKESCGCSSRTAAEGFPGRQDGLEPSRGRSRPHRLAVCLPPTANYHGFVLESEK